MIVLKIISTCKKKRDYCFIEACRYGVENIVKYYLEKYGQDIHGFLEEYAFFIACEHTNQHIAMMLIDNGLRIDKLKFDFNHTRQGIVTKEYVSMKFYEGLAEGVNSEGALLLRMTTGEIVAIPAGDVTLRSEHLKNL